MKKIISIVGARPQFIKLAPLAKALKHHSPGLRHVIVHTGQHYNFRMSKLFFDELGISVPDYHLNVGSGPHGKQTGLMLEKIEDICLKERPDILVTYGDTNSTLAGALAAVKLHIPVAHIEAGLRSRNRDMPEEINRCVTDHCSQILFCPTSSAVNNLRSEGFTNIVAKGRRIISAGVAQRHLSNRSSPCVINAGDIMFDSLLHCAEIASKTSHILHRLGLSKNGYYLATVHRAENTDNPSCLKSILKALGTIAGTKKVIFPIHPRTQKTIRSQKSFQACIKRIEIIDPVSYYDMIVLEQSAERILTDSGGVQKEAFLLGTPCVTLRNETEWVETTQGRWNILAGTNATNIINAVQCRPTGRSQRLRHFGNGRATEIIAEILRRF